MEMQGERRIPAPRQRVWERLNDPETLKACIPGCETIEKVSDTEFTAKLTARVGPVTAKATGTIPEQATMARAARPHACRAAMPSPTCCSAATTRPAT